MKTEVITWPGGAHCFALRLGELRALQDATNSGPEEVFNRIRLGTWRVDELHHVLRLGLIGAGEMSESDAALLVTNLLEQHPLIEFKIVALAVLAAALLPMEDDPVGEGEGPTAPPENGGSANSTEPAP